MFISKFGNSDMEMYIHLDSVEFTTQTTVHIGSGRTLVLQSSPLTGPRSGTDNGLILNGTGCLTALDSHSAYYICLTVQ
jgi:hypothetical protein